MTHSTARVFYLQRIMETIQMNGDKDIEMDGKLAQTTLQTV
jgi:hypothetical protein